MNDIVIQQDNAIYQSALNRERTFWGHRPTMTDKGLVTRPHNHPVVSAYLNEMFSGHPEHDWVDYINQVIKPNGTMCGLGSGIGLFEQRITQANEIEKVDLYELSPFNISVSERRFEDIHGDIRHIEMDLNFPELPENAYDLIVCKMALHHIVNLERLLFQVARALTSNGSFVVLEYVGESRYQWDAEKKAFLNGLAPILKGWGLSVIRVGEHPGDDFRAPDDPKCLPTLLKNAPFETIRSQDIVPLIDHFFGSAYAKRVLYGGSLHGAFRMLSFDHWEDPALTKALHLFVDLDRVTCHNDVLRPSALFGVFKKPKSIEPVQVGAWDDETIRQMLAER